jgi:hypothetical protein
MRLIPFSIIALCALLPMVSRAQVSTNLPATEIENFELQTDSIIVKGYGDVGSVSTEGGNVIVRCKESDNDSSSQKEYGIAVALESNQSRGFLVVDYDELDSLIRGLDFLAKISYNVTPMPAFDATVTTKSGLRVGAHTERRQTAIQIFLQFADSERISLTPDQFTQFQSLINQAKTSLDNLKNKSSLP